MNIRMIPTAPVSEPAREPVPLFGRTPPCLSVSELTRGIRAVVEDAFDDVWVEGELSNFKRHHSGHCYFTLKDADAQLSCVMWRPVASHLFFTPADGMRLRARGQISLYERRGDLQLVARELHPAGEGELRKALEALRRKLGAEGLFDAAHKQPLPPFPETIGLVTSGSGAALHDVLSVLARRYPLARVLVCPVQVQGPGAADEIAEAIDAFSDLAGEDGDASLRPDVLIVGRGGGSIEDLWAFNEERVVRAIFACRIPVVSAVGHETDFTLADLVADVRAATPSMAAELVAPDSREVEAYVRTIAADLRDEMTDRLRAHHEFLRQLVRSHAFRQPLDRLAQAVRRGEELSARLRRAALRLMDVEQARLEALSRRLHGADPLAPLRRGYARVERDAGPALRAADLRAGETVTLRFEDGSRRARVEE